MKNGFESPSPCPSERGGIYSPLMEAVNYSSEGSPTDTVHIALTNFAKEPKTGEIQRFEKWLKQRI
ncbi:MAG TPA: hypothetical protein ENJ95_17855, partial [Bacteroidetes bacterium]|nr:hypothetical protein [Bacteroidota bacterium]